MQLQLQTFTTLVSNAAAAVQAAARQLVDLTLGSTLRAVLEANASLALWLQWLILLVLQTTRAATSSGPDLDTWMADFSLVRLPAVAASGAVTFARFTPVTAALVPVGTTVRTADATQSFAVTIDTTNPAWNAAQNGYILAAGVASLAVPVSAVVPGSAGNIQAGAVTLIAAAIPGVDTVANAAAFQGGLDAESDAALRTRFQNFLASRSRATPVAIGYAVASIQQGLQYTIQENVAPDGSQRMGGFVVTVDDGSGNPPAALLATAYAAVDAVRPIGSTFTVQPPTIVPAAISLAITTAAGVVHGTIAAAAQAAITGYVNALPIGSPLTVTRLAQLAYSASTAVINVTAIVLNGGTADLVPPVAGVVKASSVVVN